MGAGWQRWWKRIDTGDTAPIVPPEMWREIEAADRHAAEQRARWDVVPMTPETWARDVAAIHEMIEREIAAIAGTFVIAMPRRAARVSDFW